MTQDEQTEAVQKFAGYLKANGLKDVHVVMSHNIGNGEVSMCGYGSKEAAQMMVVQFLADINGCKVVRK